MAQRVGRGIAILFHDRETRREVSGQQHACKRKEGREKERKERERKRERNEGKRKERREKGRKEKEGKRIFLKLM